MVTEIEVANIIVDKEFKDLCPPLAKEEQEQLRDNLERDGVLDPLVVWEENGILLDGHNRLAWLKEKQITTVIITRLSLPRRVDAMSWVINNQLGRRNLTTQQVSYLRGKRYIATKPERGYLNDEQSANIIPARVFAEEDNVSERTVRHDAEFAKSVDIIADKAGEEARTMALDGTMRKDHVKNLAKEPDEVIVDSVAKIAQGTKSREVVGTVLGTMDVNGAPIWDDTKVENSFKFLTRILDKRFNIYGDIDHVENCQKLLKRTYNAFLQWQKKNAKDAAAAKKAQLANDRSDKF